MYAPPNTKKLRWQQQQQERARVAAEAERAHELYLTPQERELRRDRNGDRRRRVRA